LLTPGEVMQLPPTDEIVMVSGIHPIRAKKARYYEDVRLQERIVPPPVPTQAEGQPDDWSTRPVPPHPNTNVSPSASERNDDENPHAAGRRLQPELDRLKPVETAQPLDDEFSLDIRDEPEAGALHARRMNDLMLDAGRRASFDRADGLGM